MAERMEPEDSDSHNVGTFGELNSGQNAARDGTEASDVASAQDGSASQSGDENEADIYIGDNVDTPIFLAPAGGVSAAGNQQQSESVKVAGNKKAQMIVATGSRTTVVEGNIGAQMIVGDRRAASTSGGQPKGGISVKGNKGSQVFLGGFTTSKTGQSKSGVVSVTGNKRSQIFCGSSGSSSTSGTGQNTPGEFTVIGNKGLQLCVTSSRSSSTSGARQSQPDFIVAGNENVQMLSDGSKAGNVKVCKNTDAQLYHGVSTHGAAAHDVNVKDNERSQVFIPPLGGEDAASEIQRADIYIGDNEDSPIFLAPVGGVSAAGNQQKSESVIVTDNKDAQMIVATGSRTTVVKGNIGAQIIVGDRGAASTSGGQLQGSARQVVTSNKSCGVFLASGSRDPEPSKPQSTDIIGTTAEELKEIVYFQAQLAANMRKINSDIGISSYSFRTNYDLVVHPRFQRDAEPLRKCLLNLVKELDVEGVVNVVVDENPMFAIFCRRLVAGLREQNLGMYIQENDSIFWLSTAHGLAENMGNAWLESQVVANKLHVGEIRPVSIHSPGVGYFRMPTPYVDFSVQPTPLRNNQWLYYIVDIMVGPTTQLCNRFQLNGEFPFMEIERQEDNNSIEWHRASIMRLPIEPGLNGMCTELTKLDGIEVVSYSSVTSEALVGRVVLDRQNATEFRFEEGISTGNYLWSAIYIEPTGDIVPQKGHSGCVWVRTSDDGYEAIAITSAISSAKDKDLWIASPLWCSLQAVRDRYPGIFPADGCFEGHGLFIPRFQR